jgi:hypothetical protein
MSGRTLAILLLCTGASAAVLLWNPFATIIVGAFTAALLIGFRWRRALPTILAGWLLYPPLAVALTAYLPALWSYLGSGLFVIVTSERLAFDYDASQVLEAPTGIDSEARSLLSEVARAHRRRLSTYAALAVAVMVASYAGSGLTHYASELIAATLLLLLIIVIYTTR